MAGIKSTSGTVPAKLNGPDINSLTTRSKWTHVSLYFPARTCTYSAKKKCVMTSSANGKCCSLTASRKDTTSLTLKTKRKESSSPRMPKEVSQTSFGHISINSSMIHIVSMAAESPWKDLLIDTSHVSKQSIMAEILGRSTSNHHGTIY